MAKRREDVKKADPAKWEASIDPQKWEAAMLHPSTPEMFAKGAAGKDALYAARALDRVNEWVENLSAAEFPPNENAIANWKDGVAKAGREGKWSSHIAIKKSKISTGSVGKGDKYKKGTVGKGTKWFNNTRHGFANAKRKVY